MKRSALRLFLTCLWPTFASAQLYTTVNLTGDRTQVVSQGRAEYRGSLFTIDDAYFISLTDVIDGPMTATAGATGHGFATVVNSILPGPPPSPLPGGCYRASVEASAQIPNTIDFIRQGAGSSQLCFSDIQDPRPGDGGFHQPGCGDDCSPIVFNFGSGDFRLTGANVPVWFDITATGKPSHIGWTAAGEDEAFLWLDRNGNGRVDDGSELFGTATRLGDGSPAANGFEALKEYDSNHDGRIDAQDAAWSQLLLWRDLNHNASSEPDEIQPLNSSDVTAIELDYRWAGRRDSWGNQFKYASRIRLSSDRWRGSGREMMFYDIFFVAVR